MNRVARYLKWCFVRCDYMGPMQGCHHMPSWNCKHPLVKKGTSCRAENCPMVR